MNKIRIISYYLPQYHPIPENNEWWGKGFTEWTNVTRAKPFFKGHLQPRLPADLGFYDLRLHEVKIEQANLARAHGVEGFCYWHYWLGSGKRILQRPFDEVLSSGEPDFPFCLAWANHDWTGHWFGNFSKILLKQEYPGIDDYKRHFDNLIKAFIDKRYILVDNKPLFYVYRPFDLPNPREFTELFRKLSIDNGLNGIYLIGEGLTQDQIHSYGFDGAVFPRHRQIGFERSSIMKKIYNRINKDYLQVYEYKDAMKYFLKSQYHCNEFPCIVPNWDSTPRLGKKGIVLHNSTPELFKTHIEQVKQKLINHPSEFKIAFLKSWNEWAEGNYIEPDQLHGTKYLEVLKQSIINN
jgi:hypothetical protein